MKSSDARGSGRALGTWGVVAVAFTVVALVRPVAAAHFAKVHATTDVYALPPPEQMVIASLGYRSALADALFAHILVANGIRLGEHRRLEFVGEFLDTINALDPTFRDPYRYIEALLTLTPEAPRTEHWLKAREIFRRGLKNRPYDTELWTWAGEYLAYAAPPYLPTEAMKREFRLEGARVLAHTCELPSNNENIPYQCVTAASLFSNAGEREAAIDSARRTLELTDDPEIERITLAYLGKKLDEREAELAERRKSLFRDAWKSDLPFISKDQMLVVGPRVDAAACAGLEHADDAKCAATWQSWARFADPLGRLQ